MKSSAMPDPANEPGRPAADAAELDTGLPGFRTWRGVYCFVLGSFLLWVVLLVWLTRLYS